MATDEEYERALADAARAAAEAAVAQANVPVPAPYHPPIPAPAPAPAMVRCADGSLVPAGTACPSPKRNWLPWLVGGVAVLAGVGTAYYIAKQKGMLRGTVLGEGEGVADEGSYRNPT